MAFQSSVQDRRPSPHIGLDLASNNPFRRAVSPQPPPYSSLTPGSPDLDERRASTNPFLDSYKTQPAAAPAAAPPKARPQPPRQHSNGPPPPERQGAGRATDLLADLSLENKPFPDRNQSRRAPPPPGAAHRQTHSQEGNRHANPTAKEPWDVFASPPKPQNENRRPRPHARRNSESSMMDFRDDDRRRRERRPGDRDRPDRKDTRDRDGSRAQQKKVRPARGLDLIDKLDITGIYGPGMFHHDGPFDACNPHRNKKSSRAAPMQAFPEGSKNNALGGSGPVNKQLDYDLYHGRTPDVFTDYNTRAQIRPAQLPPRPRAQPEPVAVANANGTTNTKANQFAWDAKEKIEPLHGEETAGLGTSTFFEGTPVSRSALHRRESENDDMPSANGGGGGGNGLQRKRSIAQKIRGGISRPRGGWTEGSAVRSPDKFPGSPGSLGAEGPQSAGGRVRLANENVNPYFADVDKKGGAQVTVAQAASGSSAPGAGMTRARTNTNGSATSPPLQPRTSDDWGLGEREQKPNGGSGTGSGLLGRVKSMRSKKGRPERGTT